MGMEVHPFDRLARGIDDLARAGQFEDEVFLQLGSCTYEPSACRFERYLSFGDVCAQIRAATCVISHAGAGSTLVCIEQGRHPILVPRRSAHKEHVDEHQVPFALKLGDAGLATVALEVAQLPDAVRSVRQRRAPQNALGAARELCGWLEEFWQGLLPKPR